MKTENQTAAQSQFTPGTWVAAGDSIITKDGKHCIAVLESDGGYEAPSKQRIGNAHLIAAAPDMFAALETLLAEAQTAHDDVLDYTKDELKAIDLAVAAIAKARGEKAP